MVLEETSTASLTARRASAEEVHNAEITRAENLMSEGKRHMICGNVPDATNCFSQACETFAVQFGQSADELGTPYLYYGKALLELGRIENDVLGHAVQEGDVLADKDAAVDEEETSTVQIEEIDIPESERQELASAVQNAMREGNMYNDPDTEDEEKPDEESEIEENDEVMEDDKMEEDTPSSTTAATKEDTVPSEESSLQLAWQMLELATVIFKRSVPVTHMKLAEAKLALAQVSMETEHYEQAVADFVEGLEYQKQAMQPDDRRIAEACYNVGLAYSFARKFSEAITWYTKSVDVLKLRIENLEKKIKVREAEEYGEVNKSGKVEEWKTELDELKDIVMLDMVAKIEDVKDSAEKYKEAIDAMKSTSKTAFPQSENTFDGGFSSKVGDFTTVHEVAPKKRKQEVATGKMETMTTKKSSTTRCEA